VGSFVRNCERWLQGGEAALHCRVDAKEGY